jgi:pimeloyl-ACP methyl ester carboxylesterase
VEDKSLLIEATAFVIFDKATKVAVLAFRGTVPDSLINWLTDAESAKYRFGDGFVYSGFFANVEAVWADIVTVLDEPLRKMEIEHLYITGHSLGAAMATLAAAKIFENPTEKDVAWWGRVRGVYAFASPMVGDAPFANEFEGKFGKLLYRYTYDQDVVPCLPPLSVDPGFKHFGHRRFARTCEDTWREVGEDRHASLLDLGFVSESFITRRISALRAFGNVVFPFSLDDHSPRGYMDVSRNSIAPEEVWDTKRVGWQAPQASALGRLIQSVAETLGRAGESVEIIATGVLPLRTLFANQAPAKPTPKLNPRSTSPRQ